MNLNLSSQIVLNTIPEQFYRPRTAVERSEITRAEKMPTELFTCVEEGAAHIADAIEKTIRLKAEKGQNCILGLGTGISLKPVYDELVRRHRAELQERHSIQRLRILPPDTRRCAQQHCATT